MNTGHVGACRRVSWLFQRRVRRTLNGVAVAKRDCVVNDIPIKGLLYMGTDLERVRILKLCVRGKAKEKPLFRDRDIDSQVSTCATLLKELHDHIGEKRWHALQIKRRGAANGDSELKFIVSHLIRWSSESVDCHRTVDFITRKAYEIIRQMANNEPPTNSHWIDAKKKLTHEHMVPCEAIFQLITSTDFPVTSDSLTKSLRTYGYRALVQGKNTQSDSEAQKLDSDWKKKLPESVCTKSGSVIQRSNNNQQYWPMLRYEDAHLVDDDLMPANKRAEVLLGDYLLRRD
jgi:hypothetical protein